MKILNWKGYRTIAWIGQALLTIFVIAAAVLGFISYPSPL